MPRRWKLLLLLLCGCVVLAAAGLGAILLSIRSGLNRAATEARRNFAGSTVEALIAAVDCESCGMRDRNLAVWALGQMEAAPALATLKKHFTGQPCEHGRRLCQYELGKAIRMIETRGRRTGMLSRAIRRLHQPGI